MSVHADVHWQTALGCSAIFSRYDVQFTCMQTACVYKASQQGSLNPTVWQRQVHVCMALAQIGATDNSKALDTQCMLLKRGRGKCSV